MYTTSINACNILVIGQELSKILLAIKLELSSFQNEKTRLCVFDMTRIVENAVSDQIGIRIKLPK